MHISVDTRGLLLCIVVTAANIQDQHAAPPLPPDAIRHIWAATFAWISRRRRCARDYERRADHHETMVHWATILTVTRR